MARSGGTFTPGHTKGGRPRKTELAGLKATADSVTTESLRLKQDVTHLQNRVGRA